jgi:hypothetical protein
MIFLFIVVVVAALLVLFLLRRKTVKEQRCPACGREVRIFNAESADEVFVSHEDPECPWFMQSVERSQEKHDG